MIRRIYRLLSAELIKAVRLRLTYAGLLIVAAGVLATLLSHPLRRDAVSDYDFVLAATTGALNLLGLVVLLLFSTAQVSSELTSGTARLILVRPALRTDFILAKLLLAMLYAAALLFVTAVFSWSLAFIFGDLVGVTYGGELGNTASDMRHAYLEGMCLSLFPLWTAAAYAVCVATLMRSLTVAIGTSILLWAFVDMIKHRLGVAPYIFSSYVEAPWQPFRDMTQLIEPHWLPETWRCSAVCAAWFVGFTAIALWAIRRRDLRV